MIDEAEYQSAKTFFIYKATFTLITKALNWAEGKTIEEIQKRIIVCEGKRDKGRKILACNWQLIIETLRWFIEETDTDPIQSRLDLIPFAK
jgi:hypothetical protein